MYLIICLINYFYSFDKTYQISIFSSAIHFLLILIIQVNWLQDWCDIITITFNVKNPQYQTRLDQSCIT